MYQQQLFSSLFCYMLAYCLGSRLDRLSSLTTPSTTVIPPALLSSITQSPSCPLTSSFTLLPPSLPPSLPTPSFPLPPSLSSSLLHFLISTSLPLLYSPLIPSPYFLLLICCAYEIISFCERPRRKNNGHLQTQQ